MSVYSKLNKSEKNYEVYLLSFKGTVKVT
jgi:hypothetical protein